MLLQCKYHFINKEVLSFLIKQGLGSVYGNGITKVQVDFTCEMQEKGNKASSLARFNWKRKGYQRVFKFTGAQQCFKSKFKDLASNKNVSSLGFSIEQLLCCCYLSAAFTGLSSEGLQSVNCLFHVRKEMSFLPWVLSCVAAHRSKNKPRPKEKKKDAERRSWQAGCVI